MAVQYTLFTDAAAVALVPFNSFLTRGQQIAQDLQILVVLGLSIYIFYQGAVAMQGQNQKHPLLKVFSASVKVVACMGFASYLGYHYSVGESIVIEFQSFFAQLFSTSANTATAPYQWGNELYLFEQIDKACQPFYESLNTVAQHSLNYDNSSGSGDRTIGLITLISAYIQSITVLAFASSIGLMLLYFRVALLICLMLAPFFIICACFQITSRLFYSWLSTFISYIFTAGVAALPVGIAISQLEQFGPNFANAIEHIGAENASGLDFFVAPLTALVTNGMLIYLCMRIPALAGKLVGGMIQGPHTSDATGMLQSRVAGLFGSRSSNLNGGNFGNGSTARGPSGRFISGSPKAGSPAHQISMGADRALNGLRDLKNSFLGQGQTSGSASGISKNNSFNSGRPKQQSIQDRQKIQKSITNRDPPQ